MAERIDPGDRDPATYSELDALAYMYPAVAELVWELGPLRDGRAALLARLDELEAKDRGLTYIDIAEVRSLLGEAA